VAGENDGEGDQDTTWLGWTAAGVLVVVGLGAGVRLRRRYR
jgi:hypothetical protein